MRSDIRPRKSRWYAALPFLAALACGEGPTQLVQQTQPPSIATVEVTGPADTLTALGETSQLSATVRDEDGAVVATAQVVWGTSDALVATVDGSGVVTAAGGGEASITASAGTVTGSMLLTVDQSAAELDLTTVDRTFLSFGDTLTIAASVSDSGGSVIPDESIAWSSTNDAVVTVNDEGRITTHANGIATILARAGPLRDSVMVTVDQQIAEVVLDPGNATLAALGQTRLLRLDFVDANGNPAAGRPVTWSSSDPTVAAITELGIVVAVANGSSTIRASTGPVEGSAEVLVQQRVATLLPQRFSVALRALGDTVRISPFAQDANGHPIADPPIVWTSADPDVVSVAPDGLLTAEAMGFTTVTGVADGVSVEAEVVVEPTPIRVDIDAQVNGPSQPIQLELAEGSYKVGLRRSTYTAWKQKTVDGTWRVRYVIRLADGTEIPGGDGPVAETPLDAFNQAQRTLALRLDTAQTVDFYIFDTFLGDNDGGVSILMLHQSRR